MPQFWNSFQKQDNDKHKNSSITPTREKSGSSTNSELTLREASSHNDSLKDTESLQDQHIDQLKKRLSLLRAKRRAKKASEDETSRNIDPISSDDNSHDDYDYDDGEVVEFPKAYELAEIPSNNNNNNNNHSTVTPNNKSSIFSPGSLLSSSSSDIFERSVQDQATISSISRRNSFNRMGSLQRSLSLSLSPTQTTTAISSMNAPTTQNPASHDKSHPHRHSVPNNCHPNCPNYPNHLNSENFVPTCLDATAEVLSDDSTDFANLEVIKSNNFNLNDVLDQAYNNSAIRRMSKSVPLTRRQSNVESSAASSFQLNEQDIDYSDRKRLNFCSFADLLGDELETGQLSRVSTDYNMSDYNNDSGISQFNSSFSMSPVSRKNSSIFVAPALTISKTVSIKEDV